MAQNLKIRQNQEIVQSRGALRTFSVYDESTFKMLLYSDSKANMLEISIEMILASYTTMEFKNRRRKDMSGIINV